MQQFFIAGSLRIMDLAFKIPGKINPYTGLETPWGLLEAPRISRQSVYEGGKVVSPTHWPPLPPNKYSWYSFLLEVKSTRGPNAAGRIKSMKNPNDPIGNTTRILRACREVPQPTAPQHSNINTRWYHKPRYSSLCTILIFSLFHPSYVQILS
jgi:hypothetical protein